MCMCSCELAFSCVAVGAGLAGLEWQLFLGSSSSDDILSLARFYLPIHMPLPDFIHEGLGTSL